MGPGIGGDELGAVTFRQRRQTLHDALDVNTHGVNSAGNDNRFRGQEVPDVGHAMTHQHFGPGAAHAAKNDAFGAGSLGFFNIFRVVNRINH